MEEIFIKLFLFALICSPFAALWSDMVGRTKGLMLRVVVGVAFLVAFSIIFSGFQQRPNFAKIVLLAFGGWPLALLIAKAIRPSVRWTSMWTSVLFMSWSLVNLINGLSDIHAFSGSFAFLFGWIYMPVPFAILSAMFIVSQRLLKKARIITEATRSD